MKRKLMCPECNDEMLLMGDRDSILKLGKIYTYCCEWCGGTFEIKRSKKRRKNAKT